MESRSSRVVKNFFDTLLDEPSKSLDIESQPLAKLLEKVVDEAPQIDGARELIDDSLLQEPEMVSLKPIIEERSSVNSSEEIEIVQPEKIVKPEIKKVLIDPEPHVEIKNDVGIEAEQKNTPLLINTLNSELSDGFPVLFFEAMGQTFSVPLVKLKGIYRKKSLSKLIGKPKWFSGVQIERDEKLNVIDTALYLMPEKYGQLVEYSPDYQYIIVIGDSNWGLSCDRLIDSTTLSHDEIKWRADITRSPWLAGTVKHRMCGLLAVDALIELFEKNETR